jgi:hypothetical protein
MLSFSKGLDGKVTASDNSKIIAPTAKTDDEARFLLRLMGMPFRN